MPKNQESTINFALSEALRSRHPLWRGHVQVEGQSLNRLVAEQTKMITGHPNLRPDILVSPIAGSPVNVETEFHPANSVEEDVQKYIGCSHIVGGTIESSIAVMLPQRLSDCAQTEIPTALNEVEYSICIYSKIEDAIHRWPTKGEWIRGDIDTLADVIDFACLSENRLRVAERLFSDTIQLCTNRLENIRQEYPSFFRNLSHTLYQPEGEQTTGMMVAILANAFIFQSAIAGSHDIYEPTQLRKKDTVLKGDVLKCWESILNINYWPIFSISCDLLFNVPQKAALDLLSDLVDLTEQLVSHGALNMHQLAGTMFQRLIADRKYLASFYTLPESATLLAELAVSRIKCNWKNNEEVGNLQIFDPACGTGSLLTSAKNSVARRMRQAGGDDKDIHARMMEHVFIGADIMPAAMHLTASTLSSTYPSTRYSQSRIYTMPFGRTNDQSIHIGSLDLLEEQRVLPLLGQREQQIGAQGTAEHGENELVSHGSCDLVIMNPPFTKPTNHERANILANQGQPVPPIPSFAAFGVTPEDQKRMKNKQKTISDRMKKDHKSEPNTYPVVASSGYAGLATEFIDLAHAKVRRGGVLATVLSAAMGTGDSWRNVWRLLDQWYDDVMIVSISQTEKIDCAFSADTHMKEVLVIGTKRHIPRPMVDEDIENTSPIMVVNLSQRPGNILQSSVYAKAIQNVQATDIVTEEINLGLDETLRIGSYLRVSTQFAGKSICLSNLRLAQTMINLSNNQLHLPRLTDPIDLPMTTLGQLGTCGLVDRSIGAKVGGSGSPQGPFDILPIVPENAENTYPALWNHDHERETRLIVQPDSYGVPSNRYPTLERANQVWEQTSSRLHFNRDLTLGSQPLAACYTTEPTLGGRAWPNFRAENERWERAILLWTNTTIGLMSFWFEGTNNQKARSGITISRLPNLMMLDVSSLSEEQLDLCNTIFDEFGDKEFLAANQASRDQTRKDLDHIMLVDVLGIESKLMENFDVLRSQWCQEPSVDG